MTVLPAQISKKQRLKSIWDEGACTDRKSSWRSLAWTPETEMQRSLGQNCRVRSVGRWPCFSGTDEEMRLIALRIFASVSCVHHLGQIDHRYHHSIPSFKSHLGDIPKTHPFYTIHAKSQQKFHQSYSSYKPHLHYTWNWQNPSVLAPSDKCSAQWQQQPHSSRTAMLIRGSWSDSESESQPPNADAPSLPISLYRKESLHHLFLMSSTGNILTGSGYKSSQYDSLVPETSP